MKREIEPAELRAEAGLVVIRSFDLDGDEHCVVGRIKGAGPGDLDIRYNLNGNARNTPSKWNLDLREPAAAAFMALVGKARRDHQAAPRRRGARR